MSSVSTFSVGQRWLSNTESELGLGAVLSVDFRAVEILFPASGESRTYTKDNAPLTRLTFTEGDVVPSEEGWKLQIQEVEENNGVLIYHGLREDTKETAKLAETFLDHQIRLNQPEQRLFSMQTDVPKWFELRKEALEHQHAYMQSSTIGLAGARIELIPHQLHIASEVGNRHAPRVLLADEVGLGKTIEAALVIHRQLKTGRAQRVLIVVPDSLVHQWLVEMLRRVNLAFAIYDESRCDALDESGSNPFENDQLVLCSISFLTDNPKRHQQALDAGWDLLVVDEAHHLAWSSDAPSEEYQRIEALAGITAGVLLLTATPDQLGHESHFARLRLLDAARFHSYEQFLKEESEYSKLADAVAPLLDDAPLNADAKSQLTALAPDILARYSDIDEPSTRQAILSQLIDTHGTGRILFRNRRAGIEGFPVRMLNSYPLPLPEMYDSAVCGGELFDALYPERQSSLVNSWFDADPRVDWLLDFLPTVRPAKVLLICADKITAQQLGEVIRSRSGIRHSVFHEGMSIVERDKAAHYFSDPEEGAQILLCSEIGSEGRNFQFAHHLVLFDLPLTPDLLEQRIGRLDRIGQTQDIQIHVPVIEESAQEVLLKWYRDGLEAFTHTCPTGSGVFAEVQTQLVGACLDPEDESQVDALVSASKTLNDELKAQLDAGRDRLLELNASGEGRVEGLIEDIEELDDDPILPYFMGRLLNSLGVNQEDKGDDCYILTPSESMVNHLPGLDPEGMTVTYDRHVATTLEHVHFLSWDHPLVHNAIDMILTDVMGKASVGFIADRELPKGAYWLEALFVLQANADRTLQPGRFMPATPFLICLDGHGKPVELDFGYPRKAGRKISQQLIQALQQQLTLHIEKATTLAQQKANQIQHDAIESMQSTLTGEAQRLKDLQAQNPAVRDSEIAFIEHQRDALTKALQSATVQLEGLRIVVNNP